MRKTYEQAIFEIVRENKKVIALVADSSSGKYEDMEKHFPNQIINFGIAESNMIAAGCGLAAEGFIPVIYALNNFLVYRAYEFIRNDACLQNRNIKFVGLGCGVVANTLGPTHHTTEDIACLRVLPNLTILSPASPKEVVPVLKKAIAYEGPVYIRLGKAFEREIYENESPFEIGKANIIRTGNDVTVFATGSVIGDVIEAADLAKAQGVSVEIVNISTIKPIDTDTILNAAVKTKKVVTVEEHQIAGGLGGIICEVLSGVPERIYIKTMGFHDVFCNDYGWHQDLKKMYGLSPQDIYEEIIHAHSFYL